MNEESHEHEPETSAAAEAPETIERRSLDAVVQGAEALGVLAGGLGGLAAGVSKLKETFGGGEQCGEACSSEAPATPSEPTSGD